MNLKRAGLAAVVVGKRVYAIGGGFYDKDKLTVYDSVEYADVLDDGTLTEWKFTSSMKTLRIYLAAVIYGDYVYAIGGEKADSLADLLNTVERAKILPDGTLGEWIIEKEKMNSRRRGGHAFVYNGWLYAMGGFNGAFLDDIEKAKINPDGSLGKWIREEQYTSEVRYISGYVGKGNRLYLVGGHVNNATRALDSVEVTEIGPDSSVGEWKKATPMYTRRFLNTAVVMGNRIYSIAGHNTIGLTSTEWTEVSEDGTLSPWVTDTPLNVPRRAATAIAVGNSIYVLGGMFGPMGLAVSTGSVESASIHSEKKLGQWVNADSQEFESYKKWKESVPLDAQNHLKHGLEFLAKKEYELVLFDASEAIKIYPKNFEAYNLMGDAYYRMRKIELAVNALKKSLAIKEDNFAALIGLGNISFENGNFKEATSYYKKAIELNPDSIVVHENLGNAYLSMGNHVAASKEFQWILEKDPKSEHARLLLDFSLKSQKK